MEFVVESTFSKLAETLLTHVQLACNHSFAAIPLTPQTVGVWNLSSILSKPLELIGHSKPITALCFGNTGNPTFLCSGAEDYIIVWVVENAKKCLDGGITPKGRIIGTCLGLIQHLAFSPDDRWVAACVDKEVFILDSNTERMDTTLEGHTAKVTSAKFCPQYIATLVSISEDRTFKIWNITESCLLYQSSIISASPFTSLAFDPNNENFAVGSADGQVRIYDLSESGGFRCLHQIDIAKHLRKYQVEQSSKIEDDISGPVKISSRPTWQVQGSQALLPEGDALRQGVAEVGESVLALHFTTLPGVEPGVDTSLPSPFLHANNSAVVRELLEPNPKLLVATTGCVITVNSRSHQVQSLADFQVPLPCVSESIPHKCLSMASSFAFASVPGQDKVWCLVGSLFDRTVDVLAISEKAGRPKAPRLGIVKPLEGNMGKLGIVGSDDPTQTEEITVLSSVPLCKDSPLAAELILKEKKPESAKKSKSVSQKMTGNLQDRPLTFHKKIKSSGYTESPKHNKMFAPKTNASSLSKIEKRSASARVAKEYPLDSRAPTRMEAKLSVSDRPTPINGLRFTGDGQSLCCALGNKSAQVFKMPLTGKGVNFSGHDGAVNSVYWSRENKWLLTGSDDRTARLWVKGQTDPLLTFSNVGGNFQSEKETSSKSNSQVYSTEIKHAQFYYMDKFILLASGNSLHMYKYYLDSTTKDDVKRYQVNHRYKLVKSFHHDQAQQITSFAAVNQFYSYIVMSAGSNKSVQVFDTNVGQSIRVMEDVHSRPVHSICQNEGSPYVSHLPNAYDLFLTAAVTDGIKLWDLRTDRCVRHYESHSDRSRGCGMAFSTCGKFIAAGSEDRSLYIYDICSSGYLHKLSGHSDVVKHVTFHPVHPELLAGTLDGRLYHYSAR